MPDLSSELIDLPEPDPGIDLDDIDALLREHYGLSGQIFPIEGRQDPYFLIDNGHVRYLLKVSSAAMEPDGIKAEHALMRHILRSPDGPRVPEPVATREGAETIVLPLGGEDRRIRLLTFLEGTSPPEGERLPEPAVAGFGALAASLTRSLAGFVHPILEREPESDMRRAGPQTVVLLSTVTDKDIRAEIAKAMVTALRRIQPLGPNLRVAAAHQNLDAGAVVGEVVDGAWQPNAVTDFTGIAKGWLVASLANTCAFLLANQDGDADAILPAIHAYHRIHPLTPPEIEALWPLVVARAGMLAAEAENRRTDAPDDQHLRDEAERRRLILDRASAASPELMLDTTIEATIPEAGVSETAIPEASVQEAEAQDATGQASLVSEGFAPNAAIDGPATPEMASPEATDPEPADLASAQETMGPAPAEPELGRLLPDIDPATIRIVDLGVTSPLLYGGNWLDPQNDWKLLARIAWETGCGATRWGEYRLSRATQDPRLEPENFALHMDVCLPAGARAVAPFHGLLKTTDAGLVLSSPDMTLHIQGLHCDLAEGARVEAGEAMGVVAGAENAVGGLRLHLCRDPDVTPRLFCTPDEAESLSALCPSPAPLLGLEGDASVPPRQQGPVRGWREYLFDDFGGCRLDFSGTAPLVGHGHPRLAEAAYRQSLLLDRAIAQPTAAQEALRARLAEHDPGGYLPISVVTPPEAVSALLEEGASPVAIAVTLASLDVIEDEAMLANARETGFYLRERLDELASRYPDQFTISGSGLMLDLALSADLADLGNRLRPRVLVDDSAADRLCLRPPLCIGRGSVDILIACLEAAVTKS